MERTITGREDKLYDSTTLIHSQMSAGQLKH